MFCRHEPNGLGQKVWVLVLVVRMLRFRDRRNAFQCHSNDWDGGLDDEFPYFVYDVEVEHPLGSRVYAMGGGLGDFDFYRCCDLISDRSEFGILF